MDQLQQRLQLLRAAWRHNLAVPQTRKRVVQDNARVSDMCVAARQRATLRVWKHKCRRIVTTPQRGANCRQAALTNICRMSKELQLADLRLLQRRLVQEHLPGQTRLLTPHANPVWTRCVGDCQSLMTYMLDEALPHCIALFAAASRLPHMQASLLVKRAAPHAVIASDPATPGLLYFSQRHCMCMVRRGDDGTWWDIPQATAKAVPPTAVATRIRQAMSRHAGFVWVLSLDHARRHVVPQLLQGLRQWIHTHAPTSVPAETVGNLDTVQPPPWLLFALRLGHRLAAWQGRMLPLQETLQWAHLRATPTPRWSMHLVAQASYCARDWLQRAQ